MFGLTSDYAKSYSQCGEDLIVDYILREMSITRPYYLDIGANHPRRLSNTYIFYRRGARGVLVEPNPLLAKQLAKRRPGDKVVAQAITAGAESEIDLHIMNSHELSTTDYQQAIKVASHESYDIRQIVKVQSLSFSHLIDRHLDRPVDFCSLDVEANMANLVSQVNFDRFAPSVWCVETLLYDPRGSTQRDWPLIDLFLQRGYAVYADTLINTIFVRGNWRHVASSSIISRG